MQFSKSLLCATLCFSLVTQAAVPDISAVGKVDTSKPEADEQKISVPPKAILLLPTTPSPLFTIDGLPLMPPEVLEAKPLTPAEPSVPVVATSELNKSGADVQVEVLSTPTTFMGTISYYLDRAGALVEAALNGDWIPGAVSTAKLSAQEFADKIKNDVDFSNTAKVNTEVANAKTEKVEEVEFDDRFLQGRTLDLKRFTAGAYVSPGQFQTELQINGRRLFIDSVTFKAKKPGDSAVPCLSAKQIQRLGILADGAVGEQTCFDIDGLVPGASYVYSTGEQTLNLSVAQAYLRASNRSIADASTWEDGVPALVTAYNAIASNYQSNGTTSQSVFGRLDTNLSAFGWLYKNQTSLSNSSSAGVSTQQITTLAQYISHDFDLIKGSFKMGQFQTSGQIMDTIAIKGASITSSEDMFSSEESGYAPEIRGVAQTNAVVTISQNGQVFYKTSVAPGPFVIKDMLPGAYSGSVQVTITESDGTVRSYLVPYSAAPQLVRKGRFRYSFSSGYYAPIGTNTAPNQQIYVSQGNIQYGLLSNLTVYGGATQSTLYSAQTAGLALGTFLGAVSGDITKSTYNPIGSTQSTAGERTRLSWSKAIAATNTSLNITTAAYTPTYTSTNTAFGALNSVTIPGIPSAPVYVNPTASQKASISAAITQPLGDFGSVGFSGVSSSYYGGTQGVINTYQSSWSKSFKDFALNLTASKQLATTTSPSQTQFMVGISIPLGTNNTDRISTQVTSTNGAVNTQTGYSGMFGENNRGSYNAQATTTNGSSSPGGSLSGQYRADVGTYGATYTVGPNTSNTTVSTSGGVVIHQRGVDFVRDVSDTMAIVSAEGAQGARMGDTTLNSSGRAIYSNLRPYRVNDVAIDPSGSSENVEMVSTSEQIIPRAGTVQYIEFKTKTGRGVMVSLKSSADKPIPFGAAVADPLGVEVGFVGQGGQVYMRGVAPKGRMIVAWGNQTCSFNYELPVADKSKPYDMIESECK